MIILRWKGRAAGASAAGVNLSLKDSNGESLYRQMVLTVLIDSQRSLTNEILSANHLMINWEESWTFDSYLDASMSLMRIESLQYSISSPNLWFFRQLCWRIFTLAELILNIKTILIELLFVNFIIYKLFIN